MEIKVEPIVQYKVSISGQVVGTFEKIDEWEGMIKLKNSAGTIIADDNTADSFSQVFSKVFGCEHGRKATMKVVKISVGLLPESIENESD